MHISGISIDPTFAPTPVCLSSTQINNWFLDNIYENQEWKHATDFLGMCEMDFLDENILFFLLSKFIFEKFRTDNENESEETARSAFCNESAMLEDDNVSEMTRTSPMIKVASVRNDVS